MILKSSNKLYLKILEIENNKEVEAFNFQKLINNNKVVINNRT